MAKKETAEQKLLKLIESGGQPARPGGVSTATTVASGRTAGEPAALTESETVAKKIAQSVRDATLPSLKVPTFLKNLGRFFKRPGTAHLGVGLRESNAALVFLSLILAAVLVVKLTMAINVNKRNIVVKVDTKINRTGEISLPSAKEVTHYLDSISERNIFKPYDGKTATEIVVPVGTRKVAGKTEKLKLRGISWLDSPETASVMIEDTETGITYFLRQGEQVKDVVIKEIFADQVILTYEGEEMAIRL